MAFASKIDFEKLVNQLIPSKWRGGNVEAFFKLFAQDTAANAKPDFDALALLENQKQSNGTPFEIQEALREITGDALLTLTELPGITSFENQQYCAEDSGFLYVTTTSPARVRVIRTSTRSVFSSFGEPGSGDGQFTNPHGIAVDALYIYVNDRGNTRVQIFDKTTFAFVGKFGSAGSGDGQFSGQEGIAVDDTQIYVMDGGNDRVQVFNKSTYAFVAKFGTTGGGNGNFSNPRGIEVDSTQIYAADRGNSRVQIFNKSTYAYITKFGTNGAGDGQFDGLNDVTVDGSQIYTTETINNRVQLFNLTTQAFVDKFGTTGAGDANFNLPKGIAVDTSFIYVCDLGNDRVKIHDITNPFAFVTEITTSPYLIEVTTNDLTTDQPTIDDFLDDALLAGIGYDIIERQLFLIALAYVLNSDIDINTNNEWTQPKADQAQIVSATNTNRLFGFSDSLAKISTSTAYNTTYTIKSISGGSVRLQVGDALGTLRNAPGTYNEVLNSGLTRDVYIRNHDAGVSAVIENIEVFV